MFLNTKLTEVMKIINILQEMYFIKYEKKLIEFNIKYKLSQFIKINSSNFQIIPIFNILMKNLYLLSILSG